MLLMPVWRPRSLHRDLRTPPSAQQHHCSDCLGALALLPYCERSAVVSPEPWELSLGLRRLIPAMAQDCFSQV
eukprot:3767477-Rhodomonas_salina.1